MPRHDSGPYKYISNFIIIDYYYYYYYYYFYYILLLIYYILLYLFVLIDSLTSPNFAIWTVKIKYCQLINYFWQIA